MTSLKSPNRLRGRRTFPKVEGLEERVVLSGLVNEFPVPTPSTSPLSITTGPDGNLWFAQRDSGTIGQITPSGSVLTFPLSATSNAPSGIARGPSGDGNLWFTESGSNAIAKIDALTDQVTEYPIAILSALPTGIVAGPDGNLWFTEKAANKVGRITTSGTITQFAIPTANSIPTGITTGPDGDLWFTENGVGKIAKIDPLSGNVTEYALSSSTTRPSGITAGPDNNLWFTETGANAVGKITPSGTLIEYPLSTTGLNPTGITSGPTGDGNLWFTESGTNRVAKITTTGTVTEFAFPTFNGNPSAITSGPDGDLWFTEQAADKIGRLTTSGGITEFAAQTSTSDPSSITNGPDGNLWFTEQALGAGNIGRLVPGTGSFALFALPSGTYPQGITAGPDGALWFTDSGNSKVGRISTAGVVTTYALTGIPGGITSGPDGNLWFTVQSTTSAPDMIGKITKTGGVTTFNLPTSNGGPLRIAQGPAGDGNLWFTEGFANKIGKINPANGQITEFPVTTVGANPSGITSGPDGNLWFTEPAVNKIGRITPAGVVTEFPITTPSANPSGIANGPDGNLWFTESAGAVNQIARITPQGVVTEFTIPTPGSGPASIVTGPDGNLWFTESSANKIGQLIPANIGSPIAPQLTPQSDTGASNSDGITRYNGSASAPLAFTYTHVSPANGFVRLYDATDPNNPVLIAGPVQASGGTATLVVSGHTLTDGPHQIAATTAPTGVGGEGPRSASSTVTIQTNLQVLSFSPSGNYFDFNTLAQPQFVIHFNHKLAGLTPDDLTGGAFANNPFAVFLLPSGPDGGPQVAAGQGIWTGATGLDGGPLPLHAINVYHENPDGSSTITLTPTVPLNTDLYLMSVSNLSDLAGNPLGNAQGAPGAVYDSFDFHATPFNPAAPAVVAVTADNGTVPVSGQVIAQPDTIGIKFNKPLSVWSLTNGTVQLLALSGPNAVPVPSSVAYSPTTQSAYLTPTAALFPGTVYLIRVDGSVNDDQGFPNPGISMGQPFYTTFTVSSLGVGAGQAPLRVATDGNRLLQTMPAPYDQRFNNSVQAQSFGYASVKFTERVSLASLGRFSTMFIPVTGGVLPLAAKLAFNPNTNQLIVVPTVPLNADVYLYSLGAMNAAQSDGSPNPGDPLLNGNQPAGTAAPPVYATFAYVNNNPIPGAVSPTRPGSPAPAGSLSMLAQSPPPAAALSGTSVSPTRRSALTVRMEALAKAPHLRARFRAQHRPRLHASPRQPF